MSLYISKGKALLKPPQILNKNRFPLVQTQFTLVPFIRKLPKIFISLRLAWWYLCYWQCFCVNADLSCSRLFAL